jgi:hypothetical protein
MRKTMVAAIVLIVCLRISEPDMTCKSKKKCGFLQPNTS